MMLFLVKYSRSDFVNAVQELSKVNNSANYAHYKQMLRAVKHVRSTYKKQNVNFYFRKERREMGNEVYVQ